MFTLNVSIDKGIKKEMQILQNERTRNSRRVHPVTTNKALKSPIFHT